MALSLDPEIAAAAAPMAGAMADATPPAVGDIAARRALGEPIIGAAGTAQPVPADVKTSAHHATATDGARIAPGMAARGTGQIVNVSGMIAFSGPASLEQVPLTPIPCSPARPCPRDT